MAKKRSDRNGRTPSDRREWRKVGFSLALISGMLLQTGSGLACGYHDPLSVQQGVLNFIYPDALHVSGAIWAQQQAGVLPMPSPERVVAKGEERALAEARAFFNTARAILTLEEAVISCADCADRSFSLLLVSKMMWNTFGPDGTVRIDIQNSAKNGLVVISDEPVILAIAEAKLSIARAHDLGLLRLYGTQKQIETFLIAHGRIGDSALPHITEARVLSRLWIPQATVSPNTKAEKSE